MSALTQTRIRQMRFFLAFCMVLFTAVTGFSQNSPVPLNNVVLQGMYTDGNLSSKSLTNGNNISAQSFTLPGNPPTGGTITSWPVGTTDGITITNGGGTTASGVNFGAGLAIIGGKLVATGGGGGGGGGALFTAGLRLTNGSAYIPTIYAFNPLLNQNCAYVPPAYISGSTTNSPLFITNITPGVGFYVASDIPNDTNYFSVGIVTNGNILSTNLVASNAVINGIIEFYKNPPAFTVCQTNASQVLSSGAAGTQVYVYPGSSDTATQIILTNGSAGPSTNSFGNIWGTNTFVNARSGTNYVVNFSLFQYTGETINGYTYSPPSAFYASNYTTTGFLICSDGFGTAIPANDSIGVAWTVTGQ
jgi:hypothetical protein